jgi:hypothetical protein
MPISRVVLSALAAVFALTSVPACGGVPSGDELGENSLAVADTDDHFNVKSGTAVSATLKAGTHLTFTLNLSGIVITINCNSFTASMKTPSSGLSMTLGTPPKIGVCTDNFGGIDILTTSGVWRLAEIDASNDESRTEPNLDRMRLTIPKDGVSISFSVLAGCTVRLAPVGPVSLTGSYDDKGTFQLINLPSSENSSSACPGGAAIGNAAVNGTIVLSPSLSDRS